MSIEYRPLRYTPAEGEVVLEVLARPDGFGRRTFFAYWPANNVGWSCNEKGTRAQIFVADLAKHQADWEERGYKVSVVDVTPLGSHVRVLHGGSAYVGQTGVVVQDGREAGKSNYLFPIYVKFDDPSGIERRFPGQLGEDFYTGSYFQAEELEIVAEDA